MIDYDTYARIHHLQARDQLSATQIARQLGLDIRTVVYWLAQAHFRQRQAKCAPASLMPINRSSSACLNATLTAPYNLRATTRTGLRRRDHDPAQLPAYRATSETRASVPHPGFCAGDCAQVDWGQFGSVNVGNTRRRLSFFVMVLCYSRLLYVEFTVSQTMEHFLGCHHNAFAYFGGRVPRRIMVDNLKSAVLPRLTGAAPVFNPQYLDFSRHYGFEIVPCNVRAGNEKGRVEAGVGYVKKNLLAGLEISDFKVLGPAARQWLDTVANVRVHGETRRVPNDMFVEENTVLQPIAMTPYDIAAIHTVRASNRFRVTFETNRYSVPAEYASQRLTLKAYPDQVCLYAAGQRIARHPRSYDRHGDFEDPDHPKALLAERRNARAQRALQRFLALSPQAQTYYAELELRRFNTMHHVQKIVALSEVYGADATARAMQDAIVFSAYSSEYITN